MAIKIQQLQDLMKKEGLQFFVSPDQPMLRFGIRGQFGAHDIVVHLQDEGRFLQFRTISLLICPKDHPHAAAVHRLLLRLNYETRLVKYGWDANDGEVVAYADAWLMDNKPTQEQFSRMVHNFLPAIDMACQRLRTTLETGTDPGDQDLLEALKRAAAAAGRPEIKEI
jgi:hypothetical protein